MTIGAGIAIAGVWIGSALVLTSNEASSTAMWISIIAATTVTAFLI